MADTYRGPAVVILDGAEHHAEVDLTVHHERDAHMLTLKSWDGTVDATPGIDWFSSLTAREAIIRMPDGREGRFFATAGTLGSERVEICGTGPAPFGEA